MSDSYIGLDQEYTIDLNRVNEAILSKAEATHQNMLKKKKGKSQ